MSPDHSRDEWRWKLTEAVDRLRHRSEHIGRKTGARVLSVLYPPVMEEEVLREWHSQLAALQAEPQETSVSISSVNVLAVTQASIDSFGIDNVVNIMARPMPGGKPEASIARLWLSAVGNAVRAASAALGPRGVVSVERVAALFPVAGPQDLLRELCETDEPPVEGPVVLLLPGSPRGDRNYDFLDLRPEFMYRGDLL